MDSRIPAFVEELAAVGVRVSDPWDLVNTRSSYPQAIPVLVDWLERCAEHLPSYRQEKFREGLVRSLAVKEARGNSNVQNAMLDEFDRLDTSQYYRWAVGNTLAVVATSDILDELLRIATTRHYGFARQMVVTGLARFKSGEVTETLFALLNDADYAVVGASLRAIGRQKPPGAAAHVQPVTGHQDPSLRKTATRVLARLPS